MQCTLNEGSFLKIVKVMGWHRQSHSADIQRPLHLPPGVEAAEGPGTH
jgi:hypothetical protein